MLLKIVLNSVLPLRYALYTAWIPEVQSEENYQYSPAQTKNFLFSFLSVFVLKPLFSSYLKSRKRGHFKLIKPKFWLDLFTKAPLPGFRI
jgi:hypothetical protein